MDMYFLFDQSGTMKEILEILSAVATELSEELAKLTTDRYINMLPNENIILRGGGNSADF